MSTHNDRRSFLQRSLGFFGFAAAGGGTTAANYVQQLGRGARAVELPGSPSFSSTPDRLSATFDLLVQNGCLTRDEIRQLTAGQAKLLAGTLRVPKKPEVKADPERPGVYHVTYHFDYNADGHPKEQDNDHDTDAGADRGPLGTDRGGGGDGADPLRDAGPG